MVQDAALSRRRSRVRLPYALPSTHFEPSQARREAAWDVSVFGVSPSVQQLYSNALYIILCYGIKIRAYVLDRPKMINGLSALLTL